MSESEQETALPTKPEQLFDCFRELGIETRTIEHAPVFTVEEAKSVRDDLPGGHSKNLFLRNKKGQMWLVTCFEDRKIDLKALGAALGAGRVSFGSPDRLRTHLGVEPGAVTPFAVINDRDSNVTFVLDQGMLEADPLNFHPLVNRMTTAIAPQDLIKFLEAQNHAPAFLDLDALESAAQES
ncbi:prolyl-tRNA synthetase associated domain-containing protein [Denitrobaculum tricleocarpae]|uniref:Prolyl-tRNA synthetase associated domain-containing protein n=1 Tax=Denitrobaculum tricleocarpae TaxID=2591009 RepID=A0A545TRC3_9PROT|nr:prolyl-tRNA synthetase associated domain-containing protein [Denitrobaculum tricleocarpae]TQV79768.1 prolyl-tRNA synthetase associated domain-containing protein [Denitrobaculum tricleocarpae]